MKPYVTDFSNNPRIDRVQNIMLNHFVTELNQTLIKANPQEYAKWQGNCCRQTAIIGCYVLSRILTGYDWQAWDGYFDDIYSGKPMSYNHAWIFGQDMYNNNNLYIDLARIHRPKIFVRSKDNICPDYPEYKDMRETSREIMDWRKCLLEKEYYTGISGFELGTLIYNKVI